MNNPTGYFVTYERQDAQMAGALLTGLHGMVDNKELAFTSVNSDWNVKYKALSRVWYWAEDGTITEVFE